MPEPFDYASVPLSELLDRIAAQTPAPSGGSVAGLALAMAAALTEMAARFSARHWDRAGAALEQAARLRERALALATADAEAYARVLAAPGGTPERESALEQAADVPRALAEAGAEVAELAAGLAAYGNPNLRGDARAAVELAAASARVGAELVAINLAGRDGGESRALEAASLAERATALARWEGEGGAVTPAGTDR